MNDDSMIWNRLVIGGKTNINGKADVVCGCDGMEAGHRGQTDVN
jgi:hypothetical protein